MRKEKYAKSVTRITFLDTLEIESIAVKSVTLRR